ncbi:MAG: hypothetical protein ACRD03_00240 [Acidimicrobiales bacterium]
MGRDMPIGGRLLRRRLDAQRQDPTAVTGRVGSVVAAALLIAAAGCGGEAVSTESRSASTAVVTTTAARSLNVASTLGDLPLPTEELAIDARLYALPAELFGIRRGSVDGGAPWYGPIGEFGIEAAEVADTLAGDPSPEELFTRLARRYGAEASECASPPARCLTGDWDGQRTVAWGHDDSPIAFFAMAEDDQRLAALLDAWRAG